MTPFFEDKVPAGFPSPADGNLVSTLDLNQLLIKHPAATFFIRVEGDSMRGAFIQSGDLLVIDRALTARNGDIILAHLNGEFTVKRFVIQNEKTFLRAENQNYPAIELNEASDFQVWGVVTNVIHPFR